MTNEGKSPLKAKSLKKNQLTDLSPPPTIYRLDSKIWDKSENNKL